MKMSDLRRETGPIPQTSFAAENIIGTPVPRVGASNVRPNYQAGVANGGAEKWRLVGLAAILIVGGYVGWHIFLKLE